MVKVKRLLHSNFKVVAKVAMKLILYRSFVSFWRNWHGSLGGLVFCCQVLPCFCCKLTNHTSDQTCRSDIRPHIKQAVSLVVPYGHFNLPLGVCVGILLELLKQGNTDWQTYARQLKRFPFSHSLGQDIINIAIIRDIRLHRTLQKNFYLAPLTWWDTATHDTMSNSHSVLQNSNLFQLQN